MSTEQVKLPEEIDLPEKINGNTPIEVIMNIANKLSNYSKNESSFIRDFLNIRVSDNDIIKTILTNNITVNNKMELFKLSGENNGVILFNDDFNGFNKNGDLFIVNHDTIYNLLTIFEYYLSVIEGTLLNGDGSDASVTKMLDNLKYTTGADGKRKLQRYQFIRTGDDINIDSISTSAFTIPGGSKKHRKTIKRNRK
jgi:hypothetical protein